MSLRQLNEYLAKKFEANIIDILCCEETFNIGVLLIKAFLSKKEQLRMRKRCEKLLENSKFTFREKIVFKRKYNRLWR